MPSYILQKHVCNSPGRIIDFVTESAGEVLVELERGDN